MSDLTTGYTFVDGEKNITAAKENDQVNKAVINPEFFSAKPASSTLDPTDQLLELKGGTTYATITGQQLIDSVSASVGAGIKPTIYDVRLRSYNAIGNPNFEVDQIRVGASFAAGAGSVGALDRWNLNTVGTMRVSGQQFAATWPNNILLPGTNYNISRNGFRVTLTTAQASLGASDALHLLQTLEGPQFRELAFDVHSLSLMVRSSVAGLKFGVTIRDPGGTRSLTKLCTISSANTWQVITMPNLPVFPTAGNFSPNVGVVGAQISIVLAAGTTLTSPANDTWQNGNFFGAVGQDNFASKPITTSTFDVAFAQWEPSATCSQFIDLPFGRNFDECLRYYNRSYDLGVAAGAVTNAGLKAYMNAVSTTAAVGILRFPKPMAKIPTITLFNHATGAAGSVRDGAAADHTGAAAASTQIGTDGFNTINYTTAYGPGAIYFHYTADSGM